MIRMNVFRIEQFLQAVNECKGPVHLLHDNGKKENINKHYEAQSRLIQAHRQNKRCLHVALEIPTPRDYMEIVNFTLGDC